MCQQDSVNPLSEPPFCKISSCLKKLNALGGRRVFVLPSVMPGTKKNLEYSRANYLKYRIQGQIGHGDPTSVGEDSISHIGVNTCSYIDRHQ